MLIFLVLLSVFASSDAYKYLVINPLFAHSHSNYIGQLADILTEAGHEVHVFSPLYDPDLRNKTGVKLTKHVEICDGDETALRMTEDMKQGVMKNMWTMPADPISLLKWTTNMSLMWTRSCSKMVNDNQLLTKFKSENYDAALTETFLFCATSMLNHLGIPTVGALSTYHLDAVALGMGELLAPSYVPGWTSTSGDKMNLVQRLGNAFGSVAAAYSFQSLQRAELEVVNKKFNSNKAYEDILGELIYLFTNSNPYLNYARPVLAKNIQIGGITVSTAANKLEKKWDDVLSLRKYTVYISFGSMAKSKDMPEPFRESLISVMESMPDVIFIWKYEEETDCVDHLNNVILSPWLPQTDLLGLGSITEVAYMGKPVIMIPIFAEQPRNAAMLARHGCGILLEKDDLANSRKIKTAINTILENDSFAKNATELARMLNSPPVQPKDLFIRHMEFAAKFGKQPQMDPEGRKQTLIQYYLLDVITLVLVLFVIVLLMTIYVIKRMYNIIRLTKKVKTI